MGNPTYTHPTTHKLVGMREGPDGGELIFDGPNGTFSMPRKQVEAAGQYGVNLPTPPMQYKPKLDPDGQELPANYVSSQEKLRHEAERAQDTERVYRNSDEYKRNRKVVDDLLREQYLRDNPAVSRMYGPGLSEHRPLDPVNVLNDLVQRGRKMK